MRVLETDRPGIGRVAFAGDGRLLLATGVVNDLTVWDWVAGEPVLSIERCASDTQPALSADSQWLACFAPDFRIHRTDRAPPVITPFRGEPGAGDLAGAVAFSPDGKTLVATQYVPHYDRRESGRLLRWATGTWKPLPGFAIWPPFDRLAYDRRGEFLAGIHPERFELRVAVTGGLSGWDRAGGNTGSKLMHLAFAPGGNLVAYGWHSVIKIMDTRSGKPMHVLTDSKRPFRDTAFTADGRRLATVSDDGTIAFWDVQTWSVIQRFDWQVGPLRCVAFSPDGACGVCGTANGKLIVFDVEE